MKKSLLALAVVAALPGVALAQSSVTLSGNIKTGVTMFSADSAAGKVKDTAMSDGSSKFIISGTEDLGGGLSAIFQMDQRYNGSQSNRASAGNLIAGGNTFVGLRGGFGQVQFGNLDTHYGQGRDEFGARATSLGASSTSLLDFVGDGVRPIANTSRIQNVIRYTTPVMSGFSAQLNYSLSPFGAEGGSGAGTQGSTGTIVSGFTTGGTATATTKPGKGEGTAVQLNYVQGPVVAGISVWNAKVETAFFDQSQASLTALGTTSAAALTAIAAGLKTGEESMKLFASYDLGVAKLGLTYDDSKYKISGGTGDRKRHATSFSVTAPVTPASAVLFHYTKANALSSTSTSGTAYNNTGATQISIGYDYSLSKRTSVGVNYSKINNQANASYNFYTNTSLQDGPTNSAGRDISMFYFGVNHKY
jgi:predicted porin